MVYDIEVTDQMGNQGCSLTEPKTTRSITTLPASGSFVRNLSMETCRPLKSTETVGANGLVNVEINNTNSGTGPFTLKVVNTDTNEVIINNKVLLRVVLQVLLL